MTVEAQYRSKCAACGKWVEEGDLIEYDREAEEWLHVECYENEHGSS